MEVDQSSTGALSFIETHGGKLGTTGTLFAFSIQSFSAMAAGLAALVTIAAVLPVAIRRWRNLLRK